MRVRHKCDQNSANKQTEELFSEDIVKMCKFAIDAILNFLQIILYLYIIFIDCYAYGVDVFAASISMCILNDLINTLMRLASITVFWKAKRYQYYPIESPVWSTYSCVCWYKLHYPVTGLPYACLPVQLCSIVQCISCILCFLFDNTFSNRSWFDSIYA